MKFQIIIPLAHSLYAKYQMHQMFRRIFHFISSASQVKCVHHLNIQFQCPLPLKSIQLSPLLKCMPVRTSESLLKYLVCKDLKFKLELKLKFTSCWSQFDWFKCIIRVYNWHFFYEIYFTLSKGEIVFKKSQPLIKS